MANTYSLDLESTSSQYAYATDSASLSPSTTYTLEGWFNWESVPASGVDTFLITKDDVGANRTWGWTLYNDGGTPKIIAEVFGDAGIDAYSWEFTPSTGTWYHLAVTCDVGNASATTFELFLNGVSQGNGTARTSNNNTTINDTAAQVRIGYRNGTGYFDGKIDEVRIWNDVRTSTEIANNRSIQIDPTSANLVGYWRLENNFVDLTSNDNFLTPVGSPVFSTDVPFVVSNAVASRGYITTNTKFWGM